MRTRTSLQAALWVMLACFALPAGATEPAALEADPPGAYLSLRGPLSVSGFGALPLAELPLGQYEMIAEGPGLPAIRGRLVRTREGLLGRSWAGPVAFLLPPGFVHLERGERRGWALMGAGFASAGMLVASQIAIKEAGNEEEQAAAAVRRAETDEERALARADLLRAGDEKADRMEVRNLWTAYLAATWMGAAIETAVLTPGPELSSPSPGHYRAVLPRAGGFKAALRSLVIPGGGQRYMGHPGRASIFFTAAATFAAATIAYQDAFLEARRDQAHAQSRFDAAGDDAALDAARADLAEATDRGDRRDVLRWVFAGATAGTYLWSIWDAFGLGQEAHSSALSWSALPRPDGVLICARWSKP
ncbi:MAG: DUF5683 domain-containing protein [Candidatus Eisenbacteria bacterium]